MIDTLSNKKSSVNVDGVFIYAGLNPNTDFIKDIIKLRVEVEQATPEELGPRPKKIEDKRTWE